MMVARFSGWVVLSLSVFLATGCVTEHTGPKITLGEKNPAKAVQLRTQLAAEYIRGNELDKAKQELDTALKIDSRSTEANLMMGVLLQQEGSAINIQNAEEYFKRAISISPKNAQARNNYGTYLFQRERYQAAMEQFKIAGASLGYEQRYVALENLGRTHLKLGETQQATDAFSQALQANRNSIIAKIELAELFYLQERFTSATQMYEDYVRYTGQANQGARGLWIGLRLARAKNDDMGMKVLANQLRAQFPDSPEYQRYLQLQYSSEAVWK